MRDLAYRIVPVVASLPAATTALAGVIVRLATDNKPYWCDGATWTDLTLQSANDPRITTARLAADVTNGSTVLANATGLAIALDANATYAIDARVVFQTAATNTGIRLTQSVPNGATLVAQWSTPTSLTASTISNQRAADTGTATTGVDTANANLLATGELLIITAGTPGTLQIRFASEVGGSNAVIKAGSCLVASKVT